MNKREEILKAVSRTGGDTVPFTIRLTEEGYDAYGDRLLKDYPCAKAREALSEGLISKRQAVELSIGNFMADCPFPWWGWDCDNIPAVYSDPLGVPSEMPPVRDGYEYAEEAFGKTELIQKEFGVYTTALIWGSHWEKAFFARGIENLLADIAAEPEFTGEFFSFIINKNVTYLEKILACPHYDGILFGSDWGTQRDLIMSPESWDSLIMPGEKREYDMTHAAGKHVMVHSCGCILKIMDRLKNLGVDILNPVQPECMDLTFLKENYGDRITFWGGISTQRTLPFGSPGDVKKEASQVIELLSRGGGYITAPSQEIQTDVPYENLKMLIDTARSYAGL